MKDSKIKKKTKLKNQKARQQNQNRNRKSIITTANPKMQQIKTKQDSKSKNTTAT